MRSVRMTLPLISTIVYMLSQANAMDLRAPEWQGSGESDLTTSAGQLAQVAGAACTPESLGDEPTARQLDDEETAQQPGRVDLRSFEQKLKAATEQICRLASRG
jgi:hypothetical protein